MREVMWEKPEIVGTNEMQRHCLEAPHTLQERRQSQLQHQGRLLQMQRHVQLAQMQHQG